MKTPFFLLTAFLGLILITSGCKKIEVIEPDDPTLDEISVSESFDWKTSKEITLHLTGYASNLARIASAEGSVYHTVFLNQNEKTAVRVTIPAYESTLRLLYMGQEIDLPISGTELEYVFN